MKADENLYFLALIPPEPVYEHAKRWKEHFAQHYNSKAALKSPPHITLHMPFRLTTEKEGMLFDILVQETSGFKSFPVLLNGFGHFNQRTIFIQVEESKPLRELFKSIMGIMKVNFNLFNADYKNRGFHPHLTLAFRDLRKNKFIEAWAEFKAQDYQSSFIADKITVLKHNGSSWDVCRDFPLK